ncbi:MAG: hypothetical protein ACYCW6_02885 [Candidatus Xenobia bacterium]
MEKEHRHLELDHVHPAHAEGEHAHDHPHLPEWYARQRELHEQILKWSDVESRYIFGCDGYFHKEHDWFFAALTRQGPHLQVWVRLSPPDLEKMQSEKIYEEHPLKTPGWGALNLDNPEHKEVAMKWLKAAYEAASHASTRAPAKTF